jgi:hypothetical protein
VNFFSRRFKTRQNADEYASACELNRIARNNYASGLAEARKLNGNTNKLNMELDDISVSLGGNVQSCKISKLRFAAETATTNLDMTSQNGHPSIFAVALLCGPIFAAITAVVVYFLPILAVWQILAPGIALLLGAVIGGVLQWRTYPYVFNPNVPSP